MIIIIYFLKKILLLRTTDSTNRRKKTEGVRLLWKCAIEMTIEIKHIYTMNERKEKQVNGMHCEVTMCCTKTKYRTSKKENKKDGNDAECTQREKIVLKNDQ